LGLILKRRISVSNHASKHSIIKGFIEKMKHLSLLLTFLILNFSLFIAPTGTSAQNWLPLGPSDFNQPSSYLADYSSIAIDGNGTPYVVGTGGTGTGKATVTKYNGSSWETVGTAGFSAGSVSYTSIAIDGSDTPYVVYQDYDNSNKATVMKYNGSSWVNVGTAGFSAGQALYSSIAIDGSGTPYVVYQDYGSSNKATVMKYNGSSWETIGTAGFSAGEARHTSITIDGSDTPYVAYQDYGNSSKATVMKYNGSSWVNVGTAGFSVAAAWYTTIAIDGSGTPYVVYMDEGNDNDLKATVMKYIGSSWETVGTAGFSAGIAEYTSIAIDGSGIPYVVFSTWGAFGYKYDVANTTEVISPRAAGIDVNWVMLTAYTANGFLYAGCTGCTPDVSIELLDMSGRLVLSKSDARFSNGTALISLNGISTGAYVVRVTTENQVLSQKIINQ
jgi:hypothetical protein